MPRATHTLLPRNRFAKRHYEAIALAMQDARFRLRSSSLDQWQCAINCLANMLAEDNGRFQRDRFVRACEPGGECAGEDRCFAHLFTEQVMQTRALKRRRFLVQLLRFSVSRAY